MEAKHTVRITDRLIRRWMGHVEKLKAYPERMTRSVYFQPDPDTGKCVDGKACAFGHLHLFLFGEPLTDDTPLHLYQLSVLPSEHISVVSLNDAGQHAQALDALTGALIRNKGKRLANITARAQREVVRHPESFKLIAAA